MPGAQRKQSIGKTVTCVLLLCVVDMPKYRAFNTAQELVHLTISLAKLEA